MSAGRSEYLLSTTLSFFIFESPYNSRTLSGGYAIGRRSGRWEPTPGNEICSQLSQSGRPLGATHDKNLGRETHDAVGRIPTESFEDLTFQFGQLFLRKH